MSGFETVVDFEGVNIHVRGDIYSGDKEVRPSLNDPGSPSSASELEMSYAEVMVPGLELALELSDDARMVLEENEVFMDNLWQKLGSEYEDPAAIAAEEKWDRDRDESL